MGALASSLQCILEVSISCRWYLSHVPHARPWCPAIWAGIIGSASQGADIQIKVPENFPFTFLSPSFRGPLFSFRGAISLEKLDFEQLCSRLLQKQLSHTMSCWTCHFRSGRRARPHFESLPFRVPFAFLSWILSVKLGFGRRNTHNYVTTCCPCSSFRVPFAGLSRRRVSFGGSTSGPPLT